MDNLLLCSSCVRGTQFCGHPPEFISKKRLIGNAMKAAAGCAVTNRKTCPRCVENAGCDPASGHQCPGPGEVNGLPDIPLPSKGPCEWCREASVTVPKDRGRGRAAAPARDRFLSPSGGFYTWFNMLLGEFGSILHSGLPRHSHFKSNC